MKISFSVRSTRRFTPERHYVKLSKFWGEVKGYFEMGFNRVFG